MKSPDKPAFSNSVLTVVEELQYRFGKTKLGKMAVAAAAGSSSPSYVQLDWLPSRRVHSTLSTSIRVPGDPYAKRMACKWERVAVLGVAKDYMDDLSSVFGDYQDSVAYIQAGIAHVGILPGGASMLSDISNNTQAFAVRQGPGSVEWTAGKYNAQTNHFASINHGSLELIDAGMPIRWFERTYEDINLV